MKFTEEQQYAIIEAVYNHIGDDYDMDEHGNAALKLDSQDIKLLDRIEQIVSERITPEQCDGWVIVEDRLPERNENVLVHRDKPFSQYDLTAFQRDGIFYSNEGGQLSKVTHWHPLPPKPKQP